MSSKNQALPVELNLVVAMAQNRVIGRDNQLPWRLPEDLAYFRRVTWGHPILMGRKTYESIGRPLPGRQNIVLTRQANWQQTGVDVAFDLDQAMGLVRSSEDRPQLMVIGGENLYRQCLPLASKLWITLVHSNVEGDAYFPEFDWGDWKQVSREDHSADDRNPYAYSFVVCQQNSV